MIFTSERLRELCPQPDNGTLETIALVLNEHGDKYGLTRPNRRAHFIAQVAHESSGLKRFIENLNYSAVRIGQVWPRLAPRAQDLAHNPEALANAAYCDRMGNGDEKSGDGWRYRGRGLIQLTGRTNYRERGVSLGLDLSANPSQAADPDKATLIALDYWRSRGCNDAADRDDVEAVTRLINGGLNGLADREELTERAKRIFVETPKTELIS